MINVWELLLSAEGVKSNLCKKLVPELSTAGSAGQELTLAVKDDGWEVRVFSCFHDDWEAVVFIPRDKRAPTTLTVIRKGEPVMVAV